eukprot:scaffold41446_cov64-Phaeocystis_antarctica.AAC.1
MPGGPPRAPPAAACPPCARPLLGLRRCLALPPPSAYCCCAAASPGGAFSSFSSPSAVGCRAQVAGCRLAPVRCCSCASCAPPCSGGDLIICRDLPSCLSSEISFMSGAWLGRRSGVGGAPISQPRGRA